MRLWRWLRSWWSHPNLVSATWLKQQKQAQRNEFEGVVSRACPIYMPNNHKRPTR